MDLGLFFSLGGNFLSFMGITIGTLKKWCEKNYRKVEDLTFQNDDFARDTIKYRFRSILCDLNDAYEDASISCRIKKIERPFDYESFYNGNEIAEIEILKKLPGQSDDIFLDAFIKKYSEEKKFKNNKSFLENAPFIDVEHFFYFYILNKLNVLEYKIKRKMSDRFYDEKNNSIFDPYKLKKKESIEDDIAGKYGKSLILVSLDIINYLHDKKNLSVNNTPNDYLEKIIILSLNSNSYDLSQLHSTGRYKSNTKTYDIRGALDVINFLSKTSESKNVHTVHYLVDNSGVEFFLDLVLGYAMIKMLHLRIGKIVYHVNVLPVFVSDVIENDKDYTLKIVEDYIKKEEKEEIKEAIEKEQERVGSIENLEFIENPIKNKYQKYRNAIEYIKEIFEKNKEGEIKAEIRPNFIWNMPTPYSEIKNHDMSLFNTVFNSPQDLLIVKGDLNYRRLCGDKSWHYKKKLDRLTEYIKTPTLVIRCYKSNVILDHSSEQIVSMDKEDMNWRTNGKYGVIKFMSKEERRQTLLSRIIKRH